MNSITISRSFWVPPQFYEKFLEDDFAGGLINLWNIRDMCGIIFGAYYEGKLAGFLLLQETPEKEVIRGLFVSEKFRKLGVGKALVKEAIDRTKILNTNLDLWVNASEGAEDFYRKFGFEDRGRRVDFPDQTTMVLYAKDMWTETH